MTLVLANPLPRWHTLASELEQVMDPDKALKGRRAMKKHHRPGDDRRAPGRPISMEALISMIQTPPSISLGSSLITGGTAGSSISPGILLPGGTVHPVPPVSKAPSKPGGSAKGKSPTLGADSIHVGMEHISSGARRMVLRWPTSATHLTEYLSQKNETASTDDLIGPIQTLSDGTQKKTIPLYLQTAEKIHRILKRLRGVKVEGKKLYNITFDDEYAAWYKEAIEAQGVLIDAGSLLLLDDSKVQNTVPFLKVPLYPWQTKAYKFLDVITKDGKGAILADDTGLGKTITVTAHLASMGYKAVVACPKSLIHLWKRKIEMCSKLTVAILGKDIPENLENYDVVIVGYSYLKKHCHAILFDLIGSQKRVFITDEGHMVRNPDAVRTEMSQLLAKAARHTVILTATPLVNRVGELLPLLKMCRRQWTEMSHSDFVDLYGTEDGQREMAKELKQFMVRRLTHEVWKNAPKGEVGEAWVELSNRSVYQEAEQNFIEWLRRNGADEDKLASAERGRALTKLNYLRQLSAQGKIQEAINIIDRTLSAGEQVVLFSAYNDPIHQFVQHFANKTGTNYKGVQWSGTEMITGDVIDDRKRLRIVDAFQAGKLGLLCIGVKAGGMGIDLPIARFAYFLDLPWTPADFTQCTGRLLRLGQERDCQFIKLLAKRTIDQRMEEIIQAKAGIFSRTIDDQDFLNRVTAIDASRMQSTVVSALISSYMQAA